jgi:hypothetical protein
MDLSGQFQIDGKDLWTAYCVFIEKGSDQFLEYAAKKESIEHDWLDSNGVDVDLSRVFLQPREITLQCSIIANDEADFWLKHSGFIADLTQPGPRRITVVRFGDRSFFVHYKSCGNFTTFTKFKNLGKVAAKFSLTLREPNPEIDASNIILADEDGRLICT